MKSEKIKLNARSTKILSDFEASIKNRKPTLFLPPAKYDITPPEMKLDEEERGRLLLGGGYLPTNEEISKVRKQIDSFIMGWKFPIVVYDFSRRVVFENKVADHVYGLSKHYKKTGDNKYPNILEILFDENYSQNTRFKGKKDYSVWSTHLTSVLAQFMKVQRDRTKEKWYTDLIKKMMNGF